MTHRNQTVEVGIRSKGSLRDQLLTTSRTFLVPRPQSCDDAVTAETVQALFRGHCLLEHVQADGAPEEKWKVCLFWLSIDIDFIFTLIPNVSFAVKLQFPCYLWSLPVVYDATRTAKDPMSCFVFAAPLLRCCFSDYLIKVTNLLQINLRTQRAYNFRR